MSVTRNGSREAQRRWAKAINYVRTDIYLKKELSKLEDFNIKEYPDTTAAQKPNPKIPTLKLHKSRFETWRTRLWREQKARKDKGKTAQITGRNRTDAEITLAQAGEIFKALQEKGAEGKALGALRTLAEKRMEILREKADEIELRDQIVNQALKKMSKLREGIETGNTEKENKKIEGEINAQQVTVEMQLLYGPSYTLKCEEEKHKKAFYSAAKTVELNPPPEVFEAMVNMKMQNIRRGKANG